MKLRNKKTGEIAELHFIEDKEYHFTVNPEDPADMCIYKKLADITEEWEDYEEPKEYWFIDWTPEIGVYHTRDIDSDADERQKEIGNYFETKEEAEKAVEKAIEKLKALKRLKDKGFSITLQCRKGYAWLEANWGNLEGDYSDVLLLFGGKI